MGAHLLPNVITTRGMAQCEDTLPGKGERDATGQTLIPIIRAPPQQQQGPLPGHALATTIMGGTIAWTWSLDQGTILDFDKFFYSHSNITHTENKLRHFIISIKAMIFGGAFSLGQHQRLGKDTARGHAVWRRGRDVTRLMTGPVGAQACHAGAKLRH